MRIKKAGGKIFGAVLSAAEKKAMDMEINRQIVEADRRYADDIDAMVLYTLHVHLGFGKKRLRKFYFAGTSTKPKSSKSKTPCEG